MTDHIAAARARLSDALVSGDPSAVARCTHTLVEVEPGNIGMVPRPYGVPFGNFAYFDAFHARQSGRREYSYIDSLHRPHVSLKEPQGPNSLTALEIAFYYANMQSARHTNAQCPQIEDNYTWCMNGKLRFSDRQQRRMDVFRIVCDAYPQVKARAMALKNMIDVLRNTNYKPEVNECFDEYAVAIEPADSRGYDDARLCECFQLMGEDFFRIPWKSLYKDLISCLVKCNLPKSLDHTLSRGGLLPPDGLILAMEHSPSWMLTVLDMQLHEGRSGLNPHATGESIFGKTILLMFANELCFDTLSRFLDRYNDSISKEIWGNVTIDGAVLKLLQFGVVLDAVDVFKKTGADILEKTLLKITGQYEEIPYFSDEDETHYVPPAPNRQDEPEFYQRLNDAIQSLRRAVRMLRAPADALAHRDAARNRGLAVMLATHPRLGADSAIGRMDTQVLSDLLRRHTLRDIYDD